MNTLEKVKIEGIIREYNNVPKDKFQVVTSKKIKQEYMQWKKELTKPEIRALKKYRRGKFNNKGNINEYLRNGNSNDKRKNKEVERLKSALARAEINENIAVYRNIHPEEYVSLKKYKKNDVIAYRDFKGTHVRESIRKNGSVAYAIYLIPKGYNCAYINYWYPFYGMEKELLINCGSKCKVVDIKKLFGKDCYILKVELTTVLGGKNYMNDKKIMEIVDKCCNHIDDAKDTIENLTPKKIIELKAKLNGKSIYLDRVSIIINFMTLAIALLSIFISTSYINKKTVKCIPYILLIVAVFVVIWQMLDQYKKGKIATTLCYLETFSSKKLETYEEIRERHKKEKEKLLELWKTKVNEANKQVYLLEDNLKDVSDE